MSAAVDTISTPVAPARPGLFAGLVRAQRAAESVAKNGRNKFHNYAYASAEDVIQAGRDALAEGGLALFCTTHEVFVMLASRSAGTLGAEDPGEEETVAVRVHYLLAHESGESQAIVSETPVIPEKGRPWDKALAAAKTFDLSYTLRGILLLPRGDQEGGVDDRNDRDTSRNGRGGARGRDDRGPPAEDRRPAQPRAEAPKSAPRPVEQAREPEPAPIVSPLRALFVLSQDRGWRHEDVTARCAQMFSGRTVRQLDEEQIAKLHEVIETEMPERDNSDALDVLNESREVQDAVTEDFAARAQHHAQSAAHRGSPRRR